MSDFTDSNGAQVHQFALEAGNLGLSKLADLLIGMYDSGVWQGFRDGVGDYRFLPGEYDYFLSQQGIDRESIIHGVQDVEVKARLEEGMDERRTGEDGYRRRLSAAREQLPNRPGRPIEPFGYTKAEARAAGVNNGSRPPLGRAPRQFRLNDGVDTKRPNEREPKIERLSRSITKLENNDLLRVAKEVQDEVRKRGLAQN